MKDELLKLATKTINDGMLLGYKQMADMLNQFLDRKIESMSGCDYITRDELNIFTETIITETEKEINE